MTEFSGSCLCGQVSYKGAADEIRMINCHCSDCQKYSGASYTTNIFIPASAVEISGDVTTYTHASDRGTEMVKHNCSNCGSAVWGTNSAREGVVTLRAGTLDQKEIIKPFAHIFCDSKIPSTPTDADLKHFDRMPG